MCLESDHTSPTITAIKPRRRLKVGLAGLGVIGEGAALRLLAENGRFSLEAGLVRDLEKPRDRAIKRLRVYSNQDAFVADGFDVIVDALSCGIAGRSLIESALVRGASIVTANKQAIAGGLIELKQLAAANNAFLGYEAAVGGGAPMIETARHAANEGAVKTIESILNGTVNFILTRIGDGASFTDAIAEAQRAGFAEPDPTMDLSGEDAVAKLSILAQEVFGEELNADQVHIESLDAVRGAEMIAQGGIWRQVSRLSRGTDAVLVGAVRFEEVSADPFLSSISGEENGLSAVLSDGRQYRCTGKGAGREPTVASIFTDLKHVYKRQVLRQF